VLEQVEGVVGASEAALEAIQAQVGGEAAQHHPLAGPERRHDLGLLPGDGGTRLVGHGSDPGCHPLSLFVLPS
jgi:hypothetical protein